MKEIRNRNKIGLIPIFHIKAFVSTKLYRQLTSLMMSIVISTVTVLGNTTVAFADKKDDVINRIIEQYENGDISRDEAKRALIRNGVTNSPIIDLNEDEDGNELATDSDLVKKLGEKDRLIDEKIRKIIEDNRDDDTSVVFAWHHEDADSIIDELSDVATKSELKKSEADDNQESKKSVGIYYDKFNKTNKSSETADSETESENIEEAVDTEDDAAVDEESVSEGEVSDENQASEEKMEDDSLDEENEDSNSVDEDEVFENDSQDNESEDFDSAEEDEVSENYSQDEEDEVFESVDSYAFFMNQLQADENETFESVEENEGFENNSQDEEAEVSESVNPYEFFMNQFQNEETEVSDSVEEDEVSEDDSQDEEDEKEDSDSVEEDEGLGNDSQDEEDVKSDSVETAEADENESEDEEKKENSNIIKVDKFFEIDSYVENEDSDSENSEEETTEAETEAAKAIGIMAHSDKNAIAQTAEDAEAEVDADADAETETDAEIEAETETKAAKAIGILAHSEKTATAQTEETADAASDELAKEVPEEEKDYDVIDLSEYLTVSSAVKKFHDEWIESESFDSGNKIGLTLYFSIPEDVMYNKDTRVASYTMPEGLSSQFEGKGKVISGDETVGTYKLKKNEIEITFDNAFVKSGKSIEGALFFKGRVENKTEEDCITIELGGTAGSLDVYKEITKTVDSDDGMVTITATFSTSTFSSNVTLHADSIDKETKTEVEEAFNEKLEEESLMVTNMYTYDVYFLDEEGEKIEPDGHVSVKMTFNNPISDNNGENLKVYHVKNNDLNEIEDLTPMDDTVINSTSEGKVSNVALVTDSFSLLSATETVYDLKPSLTNVTISGATISDEGKWIVKDGETYKLTFTFSEDEKNNISFPNDSQWMCYKIPEGLYIENKSGVFSVKLDNGKVLANNKFVVDQKNNLIKFQWNTADKKNFNELINSEVEIEAEITGSIDKSKSKIIFSKDFSQDVEVYDGHYLTVSKTGYYDKANREMHYTITVHSVGTSEDVVITDTMGGALTLDRSSFTFGSSKNGETPTIVSASDKSFELKISKMQDDEYSTINYVAKVDLGKIKTDQEATFDETGNTVTVKDNDNKEDTEKFPYKHISFSSLSKHADKETTGKDEIGDYKEVTWKITANDEKYLNLTYITDSIDTDSQKYMKYSGEGITVKITKEGSTTPETKNIKWGSDNLILSNASSSWTWSGLESYGKASYEVTYTTRIYLKDIDSSTTLKNNVETDHNKTTGYEHIAKNESNTIDFYKVASDVTEEETTWTISINVPTSGFDNLEVKDELPHKYISNIPYYDTYVDNSLTIEGLISPETYVIDTTETYEVGWRDNIKIEYPYLSIRFYKNTDVPGLNGAEDGERTITIKYKTKNSEEWLEHTDDGEYTQSHVNTVKVNGETTTATALVSKDTFKKVGKVQTKDAEEIVTCKIDDGEKEVENVILRYDLIISGTSIYDDRIYIEDSFDERMTYYFDDPRTWETDGQGACIYGNNSGSQTNVVRRLNDNVKDPNREIIVDKENHKIIFNIKDLRKDAKGSETTYSYYKISYYLLLPLAEANAEALKNKGYITLKNTAWWNGMKSETDVVYRHSPVDKKGSYDPTTGLATYTITINSEKLELNGGKSMNLEDVFWNQYVDISTLELKLNGKEKKEFSYSLVDNKLTIKDLPDKTEIVLTYIASPVFSTGSSTATLSNKATLLDYSDETEFEATFDAVAKAKGTRARLNIIKCDENDHEKLLEGAVFKLYKAEIVDRKYKYDSEKPLHTYTTDKNGVATIILDVSTDGTSLILGQLYCLVETKAPTGYSIDEANNEYYFMLNKDRSRNVEYSDTDPKYPIYPNGYNLTITNSSNAGTTLPITGGIGVNLIYLIGSLMITLGGFILIIMRKREIL